MLFIKGFVTKLALLFQTVVQQYTARNLNDHVFSKQILKCFLDSDYSCTYSCPLHGSGTNIPR